MSKIAIIGAGIAGLSCARVLTDAGLDVTLFDKGRGPGGRLSTRRVSIEKETMGGIEVSFDHGAQYFTARDDAFQGALKGLVANGAAAVWQGTLMRRSTDGLDQSLADEDLYVGVPGMNGIIRALAASQTVHWGVRVGSILKGKGGWQLSSDTGTELGTFARVVCAVPAEQVSDLVGAHAPNLAALAGAVSSLPCWAGMFVFEEPLALGFDALRLDNHPMIDIIAANHSKPGRGATPAYVVHARADWSIEHLEEPPETIAQYLLAELQAHSTTQPKLLYSAAHRWRYARVEVDDGLMFGLDQTGTIGTCGDYLCGPRIESAWLSGYRLGQEMTGKL